MSLGEKIYDLRKKQGLTQQQLASRTGVNTQTISKWELGLSLPGYGQFKELCRCFNVEESDFSLDRDEIEKMKEIDEQSEKIVLPKPRKAEEKKPKAEVKTETKKPQAKTERDPLKVFLLYSLCIIGLLAAACAGFIIYLFVSGQVPSGGTVKIEIDFISLAIIVLSVLVIALIGVLLAAIVSKKKK